MAQVCFVVYTKAKSAQAAREISNKDHNMWGEFIRVKPYFIPLVRYAMLISDTLLGEAKMFIFSVIVQCF